MSELHVVALITAKPEGVDVVRGALTRLVAPTRAESGCRSYDLFESGTEPGVFVTVERWDGQSDLDAHMASAHITQTFADAGEQLAAAPAIHVLNPIDVGA